MGEGQGWLFQPTFNRSIKIRQSDPRISDHAGAVLLREVDQRLGLTSDLAGQLIDDRDRRYIRYSLVELLRQHLYALALGYVHQDDQDALAHDVAMRMSVWDRPGRRVAHERLASQPSDWRLIERLSGKSNRRALGEALAWSIGRHQQASGRGCKVRQGTIDIDPFPIEVHGRQPGGAHHGYYGKTIYHPIVASFSAEGTYQNARLGEGFMHALLRRGNSSSAEGVVRFLRETIRKCRPLACSLDARIDAGLVEGKVLDALDDEKVHFVGRIRNNAVLDERARPYLRRDPGRPSKDGDECAIDLGEYQAQSWTRPYRLVLVVVDLPDPKTGLRDLFPHYFFLVTNWPRERRDAWSLLEHYRQRGTFEDRLSEFNACVGAHLSQGDFAANETTLLLKLLACNLAGMLRGEMEDAGPHGWDLKRLQHTVLRAGARVVEHGRRLLVDVARPAGVLWEKLVRRVGRWWRDPAWGRVPGPGWPRRRTPICPWSCVSNPCKPGSWPAPKPLGVRGRYAHRGLAKANRTPASRRDCLAGRLTREYEDG